jgi:hypothetical protein
MKHGLVSQTKTQIYKVLNGKLLYLCWEIIDLFTPLLFKNQHSLHKCSIECIDLWALRIQKRLNFHTLFIGFWNSKNYLFLATKFPQFDKRMKKIWCDWCKGGSMFDDAWKLKHIKISNLKYLILASCE